MARTKKKAKKSNAHINSIGSLQLAVLIVGGVLACIGTAAICTMIY